MIRYKNIYTSLNSDFNYLLEANEYWLKKDKKHKNFVDFVREELINPMDLLILKNAAQKDKGVDNVDKFINYLKKKHLIDVEKFCISWQLPLIKNGDVNEQKS